MLSTQELKEKISNLTDQIGLIDCYLIEVSKLPKKQTVFSIIDLDDTLFSRKQMLENDKRLRENRWYTGNMIVINEIGLHNMIEKYYRWKKYPQEIISEKDPQASLILTAWVPEYQKLKQEEMWISHFPMRIVWEGKDKVLETIRYVLFELRYIPKEIIVYEDRPQYFIEYRDLIEWVLWIKLTIMYVEMDGNNGYKKIEEVWI